MIISMGIDIVEIEEIKESIEKSNRFLERVFTQHEISYCEKKTNKYASYAARFAAKEAVMKALGTGWDKGIHWKQIEVVRGNGRQETGDGKTQTGDGRPETGGLDSEREGEIIGKPEIKLTGMALKLSKEMGVENIFLSLSHSKCNAIASVVFEGNRRQETADRNGKTDANPLICRLRFPITCFHLSNIILFA